MGIVFAATLPMLSSIASTTQIQQSVTQRHLETTEMVWKVLNTLQEAKVFPMDDAGQDWVQFVVPVDPDGDGDVLDGDLNIEFGALREDTAPYHFLDGSYDDPDSVETFTITYRFASAGVYYSEPAHSVDRNGDGDTEDVFHLGHIEAVYSTGTALDEDGNPVQTVSERVEKLTRDVILYLPDQPDGDVDGELNDAGELTDDPLFRLAGTVLHVNMIVEVDLDEGNTTFVKVPAAIDLRNMR